MQRKRSIQKFCSCRCRQWDPSAQPTAASDARQYMSPGAAARPSVFLFSLTGPVAGLLTLIAASAAHVPVIPVPFPIIKVLLPIIVVFVLDLVKVGDGRFAVVARVGSA